MYVCLSFCTLACLRNRTSEFHQIFYAYYLWPRLGPLLTDGNAMLCTSGFVDDAMFSHNKSEWAGIKSNAYVSSSSSGGGTWVEVCRLRLHLVCVLSFSISSVLYSSFYLVWNPRHISSWIDSMRIHYLELHLHSSLLVLLYSSLVTNNGSKNNKINRQTGRQKQTVSLNKRQTNYITVYKIPKKRKVKMENSQKRRNLDNKAIDTAQ